MIQVEKNHQVFIEEFFDASIERVFEAWTDPQKLVKWYAPEGCTIHFKKLEIKTGGQFHACISNPVYGDCWSIGEYLEIIQNNKIVFTLKNADEQGNPIDPVSIGMAPDWPAETLVTVTFEKMGDQTKMLLRQTVAQEIAEKTGAYPSWLQMIKNMQTILNDK